MVPSIFKFATLERTNAPQPKSGQALVGWVSRRRNPTQQPCVCSTRPGGVGLRSANPTYSLDCHDRLGLFSYQGQREGDLPNGRGPIFITSFFLRFFVRFLVFF